MTNASSRHSGVRWDQGNTRLSVFIRGTEVAYFDDTGADLTLLTNGLAGVSAANVSFNDGILMQYGTGGDGVMVLRATELTAGSELTDVIVGTSVVGTIPANSLIVSNVTASGDIVFAAQTGGNSIEYLRINASAQELVVNEASNDIDFRVESNGNTHALFVDAGNNRVGILNSSPGVALDVTGAVTASGIISADEWQTTGGGTVTQGAGSGRATGFTLSTTTGVITLDDASLSAGAEATAVWTNTTINATSTVIVNHAASGAGNPEDLLITIGEIASGACEFSVSNLSGGSLTAAVAVNFVVLGGASS
ncbi:hypothetical protein LCGC14_1351800 [marine sediment metagenome]|uniref:Uncharacterized protein n=1 Tax=marine sediment metagenome TaxID=412755 RepID=A0A0F9NCV8_9ZZZZ